VPDTNSYPHPEEPILKQKLGEDPDLVSLKVAAADTGFSGETLRAL
jgi:hypothetical protein